MLKVAKFGGSSVAGAEQFRKVRAIVEADDSRRIVVISAAGKRSGDDHKLTDLLYLIHAHLTYGVSCDEILQTVEQRLTGIRNELGIPVDMNEVYGKLYNNALNGDPDCGGLIAYNYISGEPVTGLAEGRPLFVRSANDKFTLANFMRANLYASVGVLKIGNDILFKEEQVKVDRITGHGGLFKTKGVGQRILAAAINSPISVMETAGEGGAWGIALLAAYVVNNSRGLSLADYLDEVVFAGNAGEEIAPTAEDVAGFNRYIETYKACLPIEQAAVQCKK